MAYGIVLIVHSGLRWLVLVLGATLLGSGWRVWRSGALPGAAFERLRRGFLGMLDAQMLLGVLLYALLSPLPRTGLADLGATMQNGALRFFSIEHPFGMLVAVLVAHAGLARARRLEWPRQGRAVAITLVVWLALTLASIPWPGLEYGRPLLRLR